MVRKTETLVTLTDDVDGTKADRTVSFGYDGVDYEIELSRKNVASLEKALKPYMDAARRTRRGVRSRSTASSGCSSSRSDLTKIREWARSNGFEVSDRGRLAVTVTGAYNATN